MNLNKILCKLCTPDENGDVTVSILSVRLSQLIWQCGVLLASLCVCGAMLVVFCNGLYMCYVGGYWDSPIDAMNMLCSLAVSALLLAICILIAYYEIKDVKLAHCIVDKNDDDDKEEVKQ